MGFLILNTYIFLTVTIDSNTVTVYSNNITFLFIVTFIICYYTNELFKLKNRNFTENQK